MSTTQIGLNTESSARLANELNLLLANFQLQYINTRGFHWNIKGEEFFTLHAKFEEIYTDLQLKIDEVAERILTLGHIPMHSFNDYLRHSTIAEHTNITDGRNALTQVLNGFKELITIERRILDLAGDANDEGTSALMSDYIREQEKQVWMYSAYLG